MDRIDAWNSLVYRLDHFKEILVYQTPKGYWVKNFIISEDEKTMVVKEAIGEVYSFTNKKEALDFWCKKEKETWNID